MAISTTLSNELRKGEVTLGYQDKQLVVTETYYYKVYVTLTGGTSPAAVSRLDILTTIDLPIPNVTPSPSGLGTCTGMTASRSDSNVLIWDVTATFSSKAENGNESSDPNTDPTTWVPLRETYLEPYETVLLSAVDGKPFVNGVGVPSASAPSQPKDNIRWDFAQIESAAVTDEEIAERNNTINNAAFKGRLKHTLLLKVRRSVIGRYYGTLRRLTEYSLVWNKDNWHRKFANVGNTFKFDGKIYPYRYQSDPDTIVVGPLGSKNYAYNEDLDSAAGLPSGGTNPGTGPVADGADVFAVPTDPVLYYIERRVYEESDFSFLRI